MLAAAVLLSCTVLHRKDRRSFSRTRQIDQFPMSISKRPFSGSPLLLTATFGKDYRERAAALHGHQCRIASQGDDAWRLRAVEDGNLAH
jgi:hypothetical protein